MKKLSLHINALSSQQPSAKAVNRIPLFLMPSPSAVANKVCL